MESIAQAQTTETTGASADAPAGGPMSNPLVMVPLMILIFYFFIIRPQRTEQKQHETMIAGLQKGDRVATSSGLHGRIHEVKDGEVHLDIAEKVRVTMDKAAIKRKLPAALSDNKEG
jgi:preprotein translocase subunit YajC